MMRILYYCGLLLSLFGYSLAAAGATLLERAQKGDARAQLEVGDQYFFGENVAKDTSLALGWYRKAAEQGSSDAQLRLGQCYFDGDGVAKDRAEAVRWYQKASHLGNSSAQYLLAHCYAGGMGVAPNDQEAVKWYRKAAEQGDPDAKFYLGLSYARGKGVEKNSVAAANWYKSAARDGSVNAQGNLGVMYAEGNGVPKDQIEGLAWSNIAAASGDKTFVENRDWLERQLGAEAAFAAQQRSKQLTIEIEAAMRGGSAPRYSDDSIRPDPQTPKVSGSGAIISTQGYVLSAAHVVAGASDVKILTAQGMKTATVVRIDEANDLAVLKMAVGSYPALPVSSSRTVRLGQAVATIGFPNIQIQGFSPKVTRGEISSLNGVGDDPRAWQISAPVQSGNSGGALLDEYGNLIGVVVSKLGMKALKATGDIPQNVNYAVKSTYALALLEPYLDAGAPKPNTSPAKPRFEDMIAKAQQAAVLILVY